MGVPVLESKDFTENRSGQIPGAGRVESAMSWAFNNETGAVSEVYYTDTGYFIFEVANATPAGFRPFEEVKNICKARVESEKRKELAVAYADQVTQQVKSTSDFAEFQQIAESFKDVVTADTISGVTPNAYHAKFGRAPAVIARAFSIPLNETSGLLETDRGVYWIRVLERSDFDEEAYEEEKASIRSRLVAQRGRSVYNLWFNQLKENAEIIDNRYRFFRG